MEKTKLALLSERRKPTVLLDVSGKITTLERIEPRVYKEIETFEDVYRYADAVPADTTEEYLRTINAGALLDYTDRYYEKHTYDKLVQAVGCYGLELALRHTRNGARFSTLRAGGDGLHVDERFLAVSPSIYHSLSDADETLNDRYRKILEADSY